ncbi:MAG: class D beta-lactamase [Aliarcobacter sp.]|nr:class D beta-lactamase [Aliarcobacter sp.]
MHKKNIYLILFLLLNTLTFAKDLQLEKIFKDNQVKGTIVIESYNTKKIDIYNDKRASMFLSPASTFKIPHTLIALNEGLITSDSLILWDKTDKGMKAWNKNQTLESAFKVSCVWCYKEFALKIGEQKYKDYLKSIDYGNKNIGLDVSDFWLDDSLKITAYGQIKFLKRLYANDLPFKIQDINTLKQIMIEEKTEDYILRAKSGWSTRFEQESGWYVGYVETKDDVWFFATNIITKGAKDLAKRKEITLEALRLNGIIK